MGFGIWDLARQSLGGFGIGISGPEVKGSAQPLAVKAVSLIEQETLNLLFLNP